MALLLTLFITSTLQQLNDGDLQYLLCTGNIHFFVCADMHSVKTEPLCISMNEMERF